MLKNGRALRWPVALLAIGVGLVLWWNASRPSQTDAASRRSADPSTTSGSTTSPNIGRAEVESAGEADRAADSAPIVALPSPPIPGRIVGRALDERSQPVPSLRVDVQDPSKDWSKARAFGATTDGDGRYSIDAVPPGTWALQIRGPEGLGRTRVARLVVDAGTTTTFDIALVGTRKLSGVYEHSHESENADGAAIRLELVRRVHERTELVATALAITNLGQPTRSGQFALIGIQPGVYELRALPFADATAFPREVDLTAGDTRLTPWVFGPDLAFHEVTDHPGAEPFDSRADER